MDGGEQLNATQRSHVKITGCTSFANAPSCQQSDPLDKIRALIALANTTLQKLLHNGYRQVPFTNIRSTDVEFTSFAHVGPGFLSAPPLLPLRAWDRDAYPTVPVDSNPTKFTFRRRITEASQQGFFNPPSLDRDY